jgi:hypothetical protein
VRVTDRVVTMIHELEEEVRDLIENGWSVK